MPEYNQLAMAGFRQLGYKEQSTSLMDKGVGNWEKHTKGIGAKLLLQVRGRYEILEIKFSVNDTVYLIQYLIFIDGLSTR